MVRETTAKKGEIEMKIRIVNKFHNRECFAIVDHDTVSLTASQTRRVSRSLCPHSAKQCQCFGSNTIRIYDNEDSEIGWMFSLDRDNKEIFDLMGYNYK
jgi:hypothetical protein